MTMAESWERVSSEQVADCRVFRVRRDKCKRSGDGKGSDFFVIESPDWVNIIPVTKNGEIVMIEQFRQGTGEMNLELPGGIVDDDEQPDAAARRELLEETGYSSGLWVLLGTSRPNPAIQSNTIYHYLARNCEKTAEIALDPNESIITRLINENEAEHLIGSGAVSHSLVVAAFLYFRLFCQSISETSGIR
jgi:ADP-ribose pyrophosphatase